MTRESTCFVLGFVVCKAMSILGGWSLFSVRIGTGEGRGAPDLLCPSIITPHVCMCVKLDRNRPPGSWQVSRTATSNLAPQREMAAAE